MIQLSSLFGYAFMMVLGNTDFLVLLFAFLTIVAILSALLYSWKHVNKQVEGQNERGG